METIDPISFIMSFAIITDGFMCKLHFIVAAGLDGATTVPTTNQFYTSCCNNQ